MTRPTIDKTLIGSRSDSSRIRIESGQLRFFAKATDQRDPVYFDLAAARAAGYRGLLVPPTFTFSLALACPEQAAFALLMARVTDGRYVLHAEQGFRSHAMIFGEDEVTLTTEIRDIYEKKGGALTFLAQSTEVVDAHGKLCAECNTTFVIRPPGT